MKKISIYLIFMLLFCSCQQNSDDSLDQNSTVQSSAYLDIAADLDNMEISNLSIEEEKIYYEAKKRFGTLVEYKNEQFYLKHDNYKDINISSNLFDHFKEIMNRSNKFYNQLSKGQKEEIVSCSMDITRPITRNRGEIPAVGDGGFVRQWYGFDVYLTNRDLRLIQAGTAAVAAIAYYVPELYSKGVAGACTLASALAGFTAELCPNGIVVSFVYPVPTGCFPVSASRR